MAWRGTRARGWVCVVASSLACGCAGSRPATRSHAPPTLSAAHAVDVVAAGAPVVAPADPREGTAPAPVSATELIDALLAHARGEPDAGPRLFEALQLVTERETDRVWHQFADDAVPTTAPFARRVQRGAVLSPGGALVARSGRVQLWDVRAGAFVAALPDDAPRRALRFSPRETWLATLPEAGDPRELELWDARTGAAVFRAGPLSARGALAFAPDDAGAAVALRGGVVRVVALPAGTARELRLPGVGPTRVAYSPDGTVLAASRDWSTAVYDTATLRERCRVPGTISVAPFFPGGARLLTLPRSGPARIWDARSGEVMGRLGADTAAYRTAEITPDGEAVVLEAIDPARTAPDPDVVAEFDAEGVPDNEARREAAALLGTPPRGPASEGARADRGGRSLTLHDVANGSQLGTLPALPLWFGGLTADGRRVLTWRGPDLAIFDAHTGQLERLVAPPTATPFDALGAAVEPAVIVGVQRDRLVRYRVETGEALAPIALPVEYQSAWLDVASSGRVALVGGSAPPLVLALDARPTTPLTQLPELRWYERASGGASAIALERLSRRVAVYEGPALRVRALLDGTDVAHGARRVVTHLTDGRFAIHDRVSGARLCTTESVRGDVHGALSADEHLLRTTGGESAEPAIALWSADNCERIATLPGFESQLAANGARLVLREAIDPAFDRFRLQLVDTRDGRLLGPLAPPLGPAADPDLLVSDDGRCVLSIGDDGAARVWDARTGATIARLGGSRFPSRADADAVLRGTEDNATPREEAEAEAREVSLVVSPDCAWVWATNIREGALFRVADGRALLRVRAPRRTSARTHQHELERERASLAAQLNTDEERRDPDELRLRARFSRDGHLAVAAHDDVVYAVDTGTGRVLTRMQGWPVDLLIEAGDARRTLLMNPDQTLTLYDTATGQRLAELGTPDERVLRYLLHRERDLLVLSLDRPTAAIELRSLRTGALRHALPLAADRGLVLDPSGARLAHTAARDVTVWDTATGRRELAAHAPLAQRYRDASFDDPDTLVLSTEHWTRVYPLEPAGMRARACDYLRARPDFARVRAACP